MVWFDIIAGAVIVFLVVVKALRPFRRWIQRRIDRQGTVTRPPVVLLPPPKDRERNKLN